MENGRCGRTAFDFPRIQGAVVAGRIFKVGERVSDQRVGERVLVDPRIRDLRDPDNLDRASYLGNATDGGFGQFCKVSSINAVVIRSNLSPEELATFPCSSSVAELLLFGSHVSTSETALVTGASEGVGLPLVQLVKRRGAFVIALTSRQKLERVMILGADKIEFRDAADLAKAVKDFAPNHDIDVISDIAGGKNFPVWTVACVAVVNMWPLGRYLVRSLSSIFDPFTSKVRICWVPLRFLGKLLPIWFVI